MAKNKPKPASNVVDIRQSAARAQEEMEYMAEIEAANIAWRNPLTHDRDLTYKLLKLTFEYPHLAAREIVPLLKSEHPKLDHQTITWMIKNAIRNGLVTTHINYPYPQGDLLTLELELLQTFPELEVAKVESMSELTTTKLGPKSRLSARRDVLLRLVRLAAGIIDRFLAARARDHGDESTVVGIGWGRTMFYLLRCLESERRPQYGPRVECMPILATGNTPQRQGLDGHNLATRLAEVYGGQAWPLQWPALPNNVDARGIRNSEFFTPMKAKMKDIRLVINSVSEVVDKGDAEGPWLSDDPLVNEALRRSDRWEHIRGRIGLWFYDENGFEIPLKYRQAMGIGLQRLKRIASEPDRICMTIAGGDPARVPAILGALRGRMITHLLTDEHTARALIAAEKARRGA